MKITIRRSFQIRRFPLLEIKCNTIFKINLTFLYAIDSCGESSVGIVLYFVSPRTSYLFHHGQSPSYILSIKSSIVLSFYPSIFLSYYHSIDIYKIFLGCIIILFSYIWYDPTSNSKRPTTHTKIKVIHTLWVAFI